MALALPVIRAEVVAVVNEAPATARVESSGAGSLEERIAARARGECRPCWRCARSFVAENERGEANYRVRTSECGTSQGNNCCAPSCFNQSYVVDVFDPEEAHVVARSANVWPGCNCAGATERSNIVLRFPKNATDRERASLVAATVLVEFAHFEWKKGDNQEGGPVGMLL